MQNAKCRIIFRREATIVCRVLFSIPMRVVGVLAWVSVVPLGPSIVFDTQEGCGWLDCEGATTE